MALTVNDVAETQKYMGMEFAVTDAIIKEYVKKTGAGYVFSIVMDYFADWLKSRNDESARQMEQHFIKREREYQKTMTGQGTL